MRSPTPTPASESSRPIGSLAAQLSAAVAAVGILFLILMYVGLATRTRQLLVFGPLNDVCVLVQYALALPVVGALDRRLTALAAPQRRWLLALGLLGCGAAVVLQGLLLLGIMSFREQVGYASAAVLLAGVWTALAGLAARRHKVLDVNTRLLVGSALYFGYPLWAFRVSQQLRTRPEVGSAAG